MRASQADRERRKGGIPILFYNNLKAFLTQLSVVTLFLLLILLEMLIADAAVPVSTALAFGGLLLKIYLVLSFAVPTVLYLWMGSRLRSEGSALRDFLSVVSVAVLGVAVWGYSFHASLQSHSAAGFPQSLFQPGAKWIYYLGFNPAADAFLIAASTVRPLRAVVPYILLVLAFYPTLLLWIGLRRWGER